MTSLPKIDYPIYNILVPSLKKEFKFRPFLVKEEKILFMAKESENEADVFNAIKQIATNCSLEKTLNIDDIAIFDLEYIFLKLRAISVDNKIKISYRNPEDDKVYDFDVDLNDVKITIPEKVNNVIKINEKIGLILKYPSASLYSDYEFLNLQKDHLFELIIRCIDKIFFEDEIFEAKNFQKKELEEFLENLSVKVFEDVKNFFENSPKLIHEINYKNSLGNDSKIVLSSLNDFFSWR